MRRKRVIVGLVALALVGATGYILWPRGPRPCLATFEQVQEGMTYAEVCATIGEPPGIYTRRPCRNLFVGIRDCRERWAAADGELIAWFDDDHRAFKVAVFDPMPDPRSWADRLRARLGL